MYSDLVFPNGNEEKFIEMALQLGYSNLYFIHPIDKFKKTNFKNEKLEIKTGILSDIKNFQKAKKFSEFVIIKSSSQNRHVLEKLKPAILYDLEKDSKQDFIHHRASGLNQVLCKIAKDSNTAIGFSFNSILNLNSRLLGRISQNIALCRKYKIKTAIASFADSPYKMRSPHDLIALFICLGMHPSEAKKALVF